MKKIFSILIILSFATGAYAQYGGLDTTKFPWLQKKKELDSSRRQSNSVPLPSPVTHDNPATNYRTQVQLGISDSSLADRILATAYSKIGSRYKFGGKGPNVFDCAGFTRWVFMHYDIILAPSAGAQFPQGKAIRDTRELRPGDLVFYGARRKNHSIGHVGMVVDCNAENGHFRFIHSSTSLGVVVSFSTEPYYAQRYISACRVLQDGDWIAPASLLADSLAKAEAEKIRALMIADSMQREKIRQDSLRVQLEKRLEEAKKDVENHKNAHRNNATNDFPAIVAPDPRQQHPRK